jgi:hypothetical protein
MRGNEAVAANEPCRAALRCCLVLHTQMKNGLQHCWNDARLNPSPIGRGVGVRGNEAGAVNGAALLLAVLHTQKEDGFQLSLE